MRKLLILAVLAASCSHSGIMKDVAVKTPVPEKTVSLNREASPMSAFQEVLSPIALQIIDDTLLVIQERASDEKPYHFKAYSLNTLEYLGPFVRNGRGPGEMVSPHLDKLTPDAKFLKLTENMERVEYLVDVKASIESNTAAVVGREVLGPGVISRVPLPDGSRLCLQMEGDEELFRVYDGERPLKTFRPYRQIDGNRSATQLSSILVNDGATGKVAEVMLFLPQINMIDVRSGRMMSVAVGKGYRNWESVIDGMIDMDTVQYYSAATSTAEYIFAAYDNVALGDLMEGNYRTSIHVFDWDGRFLCEISLAERISDMAFDAGTKCLYCIEKSEGQIIRYDLSKAL